MASSARSSKQSPLSSTLITATRVLSIVRIGIGGACFLAPKLTLTIHDYHVPAPYSLLVRMMGAREAINGGLLLAAPDAKKSDGGRSSIRTALWVGMIADSMDVCSCLYGYSMGEVGTTTAGELGTAAAGAITMAIFMLRAL